MSVRKSLPFFLTLCLMTGVMTMSPSAQARGLRLHPVEAPEVAGPGWHLVSADPVSPGEARRTLLGRAELEQATVAGLATCETEATPEIQALARGLENDPKLIFDYVHNYLDYLSTFGSVNGATGALLAGRGNDWDQTSLFIALMRAAGWCCLR